MNKACTCYSIYWADTLIGFRSYLPMPSGTSKFAYRGSRLVILPDYQGLGFGSHIMDWLGEYYLSKGLKYYDRSSHLRLGIHWGNSPKWKASSSNNKKRNDEGKSATIRFNSDPNRICYSYEYMGIDYATKPHKEIVVDIINKDTPNFDLDAFEQDLIELKKDFYLTITTGEINTYNEIEQICLKNGIRTELLYHTKNGVANIKASYKNKPIITTYSKGDLLDTNKVVVCLGECDEKHALEYVKMFGDNVTLVCGCEPEIKRSIWEDLGYPTRKLWHYINNKFVLDDIVNYSFNAIITTQSGQEQIKPYKHNINKMVTLDFRQKEPTIWTNL